jgi:omega-6 fatty acid desaturase (delta-12 desaturase)
MALSENIEKMNWQELVAPYAKADRRRSLWQVGNTLAPFFALWALMYWSLGISYWLTLLLALPTAGLMMRAFIIFHDCCHGSFFAERRGNEWLGSILGVIVFTPFFEWRHSHAVHHATAGNLDRRGRGDVTTMTVQEYLSAPVWKRAGYRLMRNPLFLFTIGAWGVFFLTHRFWVPGAGRRERWSVIYTNLAFLAVYLLLGSFLGYKEVLLVQVPIVMFASSLGVWLFYVQHQFDGVYWARQPHWNFVRAGLQGSSFYKLPAILNWFSGNIGYHHIHHLSSKIPNYNLPKCYHDNLVFQIKPLTILTSLKSATMNVYDEAAGRLISFSTMRKQQRSIS